MQPLKELIQLTKKHSEEEYDSHEWIATTKETHQFFRHLAVQSKPVAKTPTAPPPKKTGTVRTLSKPTAKKAEQVKVQEPPPPEPVTIKPVEKEKPRDLSAQLDLIRKTCPNLQVIAEIPEPAGPKKVSIVCDQSEFWNKVAGALRDRGVEVEVVDEPSKVSGAHLVFLPRDIEPPFQGIDVIKTKVAALYQKDTYKVN